MRLRPIVGAVIAVMAFGSGCGSGKPVSAPASEPGPVTTSGPARKAVKYGLATFKSCPEIRRKLPDLPPPLRSEPLNGDDQFSLTCTFTTQKNGEPMITFQVELYDSQGDVSGADRGRSGFSNSSADREKDTRVPFGSEARWADRGTGASCRLEVLDENAVMITSYHSGKKLHDPRSEECRQNARDIAKQLYEAVQPQ